MKKLYDRIHELFDYYDDGYLVIKKKSSPQSHANIGDIAGSFSKNWYSTIKIDYKTYHLHRIIFLWHHGYLPENDIDHIDRDKNNNRIENLREVSRSCNMKNVNKKSNNTSGVIGVQFNKRNMRWISLINVNKKQVYIGSSFDFDDAVMIRWKKEVELNWNGCNSTSSAYLYLKEKGLL